MKRDFFLTRHSIKPKGNDVEDKKYKGISKKGVALARKSSKDILKYIEKGPDNEVIFLGGVSDEIRTKSTADVYGQELKRMLKNDPNYVVITSEDVRWQTYDKVAGQLKEFIDRNPDKKIIIDVPFFMNEFSLKSKGWLDKEGKPTPYLSKLLEIGGGDEEKALKYWMDNQGKIEGLVGPTPLQVAKGYEQGVNMLQEYAKSQFGDRPYVVGIVGHSFEADTFLTYVAGSGQIDSNIYSQLSVGKGIIKETELASVNVKPDVTTVSYRGEDTKAQTLETLVKLIFISSFLFSLLFSTNITGNAVGVTKSSIIGLIFVAIGIISAILLITKRKKQRVNYFILNK
ncbi:hypothetical protein GOV14_05525 [Candidatus Pacearchaeota archaeon]|nr:hypothetical protein [Candidatus Pacearchaeota archaeon]